MAKAIIFDWGGVLTSGKYTHALLNILSKKYNKDFDEIHKPFDDLIVLVNGDEIDFDEFIKKINEDVKIPVSKEEMLGIIKQGINHNEQVVNLINQLKGKYKLMMLSDNDRTTVNILREDYKEVLELFDKTYFSYDLGVRKPNKEIFEHLLSDSGLKAEDCIFIDDKEKNINAAKKLGFEAVLFKDYPQLVDELNKLGIKT
ncbi:MAG: HAD family phosphatase [archaeon]